LLEIHKNERCEAMSSREWEQMHRKSVSQIGGWSVELEGVWMWKSACVVNIWNSLPVDTDFFFIFRFHSSDKHDEFFFEFRCITGSF